MAAIKSYTDISQSKKLAEILSLESADMYYAGHQSIINPKEQEYEDRPKTRGKYISFDDKRIFYPCWSLAALLEEIPSITVNIVGEDLKLHIDKDNLQYSLFYENEYTGNMFEIETELYDSMIDACYEMILKLHELNLL